MERKTPESPGLRGQSNPPTKGLGCEAPCQIGANWQGLNASGGSSVDPPLTTDSELISTPQPTLSLYASSPSTSSGARSSPCVCTRANHTVCVDVQPRGTRALPTVAGSCTNCTGSQVRARLRSTRVRRSNPCQAVATNLRRTGRPLSPDSMGRR